jgi:hypothetical protein
MIVRRALCLLLAFALLLPATVAACTGGMMYFNTGNSLLEWCNGTQWYSAQGTQLATASNYITSGSTWVVPGDWNNSNNKIELISGGGGGGNGWCGASAGAGGYVVKTNLSLTPGATVHYQVGAGGTGGSPSGACDSGTNGGDTFFNGTTTANASVWIAGGQAMTGAGGSGLGGQLAAAAQSLQAVMVAVIALALVAVPAVVQVVQMVLAAAAVIAVILLPLAVLVVVVPMVVLVGKTRLAWETMEVLAAITGQALAVVLVVPPVH